MSVILDTLQSLTPGQWLAAIVVLLTSYITYNAFLHPLALYPGPISARLGIPGLYQFQQAYRRRYAWELEKLHDKYGTIVRVSSNHISINTPEAASQIYAHGTSHTFPKTRFYQSFQVFADKPSVFSEIDPDKHASFRRAISAAYSMSSLVKLEQYIQPLIHQLVQNMESAAKQNEVLDLSKWMHFFAMDAVGELAFGRAFGFVERGSDPDRFLLGVSNLSHFGSMAGWTPSVSISARKFLRWLSGEPGAEKAGVITKALIDKRYEILNNKDNKLNEEALQIEDRQDMLARFIECKNPLTSKKFSQQEVLQTAISVVGAGSDTTSTALVSFFGYLVRHPEVYKELQQEVDDAFDTGLLSWPVQYNAAVNLPVLQACIKETLRLHPPISMSLPRTVAENQGLILRQGISKPEIVIPQGCQVSVAPYVLHRSPAVFGEDSRSYKPERWLNLDEEKRKAMERNNLTFGGGSRQCIGKNISLMEINKVLPTLLRCFTFSLPLDGPLKNGRDSDGNVGSNVPWKCQSTWFLEVQTFPVLVSRRDDIDFE